MRALRLIAIGAGLLLFVAIALLAATMLPAVRSLPPVGLVLVLLPAPLVYLAVVLGSLDRRRVGAAKAYLAGSVVLTLVMLAGVAWVGTERALHPGPCEGVPELSEYPELEAAAEDVHFESRDGTALAGWFIPGREQATVLLLHGYGCKREAMLPHAYALHETGYSVLLFDFRSRGESAGDVVTMGYYEREDALAALDYLRTRNDVDAERIGVLGVSLGGAVAILAAAEEPSLRAVAVESTFRSVDSVVSQSFTHFIHLPAFPFAPLTVLLAEQRLGIDSSEVAPERDVASIAPRPLLLMHGTADKTISADDGVAVFAAAGQPKQWWLIPEAEHAKGIYAAPEEYRTRLTAFFDAYLR